MVNVRQDHPWFLSEGSIYAVTGFGWGILISGWKTGILVETFYLPFPEFYHQPFDFHSHMSKSWQNAEDGLLVSWKLMKASCWWRTRTLLKSDSRDNQPFLMGTSLPLYVHVFFCILYLYFLLDFETTWTVSVGFFCKL